MICLSLSLWSNPVDAMTMVLPAVQSTSLWIWIASAPASAVAASLVQVCEGAMPCSEMRPPLTPMNFEPNSGSFLSYLSPQHSILALPRKGSSGSPITSVPSFIRKYLTCIYSSISALFSNFNIPSTVTRFSLAVGISSKTFIPAGIHTESPSTGGGNPPQVVLLDQSSI